MRALVRCFRNWLSGEFIYNRLTLRLICLCSNIFEKIVGFTQLDFYPHIAAPFLQKLALKVFIEKYSLDFILGNLLVEEQNLSRNTDVAVMDAKQGWRIFLSSGSVGRPLGVPIPPQCPGCGRINCAKWQTNPPADHFTLHVTCKFCPHVYQLQPGIDDYFTPSMLKGKEGWGIGIYWGPYLDSFPNGTEAYSRGDIEDEISDHIKSIKSKEHYKKREGKKGDKEVNADEGSGEEEQT
jgi:hypothetical protein